MSTSGIIETVSYIALLRGINVGGNNIIKMAELRECITGLGFENVRTYIQSGNILFESTDQDSEVLETHIQEAIAVQFSIDLTVVVVKKQTLQKIINNAPSWWGKDDQWKHNLIFLIRPFVVKDIVAAIGELKPDIEAIKAGDGVIYQSISKESFGKTTSGKLASNPIYKKMTIRNFNTANKLLTK
jgi:uncharacterized protein (DUF1697 family)